MTPFTPSLAAETRKYVSLLFLIIVIATRRFFEARQGQAAMENAQAEKGAFYAGRANVDSQGIQHIILAKLDDFLHRFALDHLGEHGGRGLADGASTSLETYL